jgi:hypothetical protein
VPLADAATGGPTAGAGRPTSAQSGVVGVLPAAARGPSRSTDQALVWVLRATALALLPLAFLLGGRRRPRLR